MSDDPRKAIVGTWRLVHTVEYGPDADTPLLPSARMLSDTSTTPSRARHGRAGFTAERAEHARKPGWRPPDYLATGRYELDTENQLVRHFLEGQVHPGRHPDTLERKYRFYDDRLSLRPLEGTDRGDPCAYLILSTRGEPS